MHKVGECNSKCILNEKKWFIKDPLGFTTRLEPGRLKTVDHQNISPYEKQGESNFALFNMAITQIIPYTDESGQKKKYYTASASQ
jgi:hypothetical protein